MLPATALIRTLALVQAPLGHLVCGLGVAHLLWKVYVLVSVSHLLCCGQLFHVGHVCCTVNVCDACFFVLPCFLCCFAGCPSVGEAQEGKG